MCHLKKIIFSFAFLTLLSPLSVCANHFNYYQLKMGAGLFNTETSWETAPMLSFGTRVELEDSAIEISAGYGNKQHNGNKFSYYSLPKITYVQFHEPDANSGFYYGGGLSFSSMKYTPKRGSGISDQRFTGLFAEGTVGYEFKRNAAICPIVYLDISQPMIAEKKVGRHPGPAIMTGMSIGFM